MSSTSEPTVENLLHNIQSLSSAIIVSVNDALIRAVQESDEVSGGEKDGGRKLPGGRHIQNAKKNSAGLRSELLALRREQQLSDTASMLSIKALHPQDVDRVVQQFSEQQMRRRHRVRDARVLRVPYNALLENVSQTLHVDSDFLKAKIEIASSILPPDTPTPAESGRRDEDSGSRKAHRYALNSAGVVYSIDLMRHQLAAMTRADQTTNNRNLSLAFEKPSEFKSLSLSEWNPQPWARGLSGDSGSGRWKAAPPGTSSGSVAAVTLDESFTSLTMTSILGETGRRRHNRMVRFVEDISVSSFCKTGTVEEIAASQQQQQQPVTDQVAGEEREKGTARDTAEEQSERLMGPTDSNRTQEDEEMLVAFQCGWTVPREVRIARMACSAKGLSLQSPPPPPSSKTDITSGSGSSTAPRPSILDPHLIAELDIQRKLAIEDNFSKEPVSIRLTTTWPGPNTTLGVPLGLASRTGTLPAEPQNSEPRTKWIVGTLKARKLQTLREQEEVKESAHEPESAQGLRASVVQGAQSPSGTRASSIAHSGVFNNLNVEEAQLEPPASGGELHTYEVDYGLGITPRRQTTRLSTILAAGAAKFQEYLASPRGSHNRKDETSAASPVGRTDLEDDDEVASTASDDSVDSILVDVIANAATSPNSAVNGAERLQRANESLAELRNVPTPFRHRDRSRTNSHSGKGSSLQGSLLEMSSRAFPTSPLAQSGSAVKNRSADLASSGTRKRSFVSDGSLNAGNSGVSFSGSLPPSATNRTESTRTSSVRKNRPSCTSPSVRSGGGFHSAERAAARHHTERGEILKAARAASVSHNRSQTQPRSSSTVVPRPPQVPTTCDRVRTSIPMEPLEKPAAPHSTQSLVSYVAVSAIEISAGRSTPKGSVSSHANRTSTDESAPAAKANATPEAAHHLTKPIVTETHSANTSKPREKESLAPVDGKVPVPVDSARVSTPKATPVAPHDPSDAAALPSAAGSQQSTAAAPPASGRKVLSGRQAVLKSRVSTNAKRHESPEPVVASQQAGPITPKTRPASHSASALLRSPHIAHSITKSPQGPTSFSLYASSHHPNGDASHGGDVNTHQDDPSNPPQLAGRGSSARRSEDANVGSARDVCGTDRSSSSKKTGQTLPRSRILNLGGNSKKSGGAKSTGSSSTSAVLSHDKSPSTSTLPSTSTTVVSHAALASENAPVENEHTSQARSSARQLTPHSAHTKPSTPHEKPRQSATGTSGIADIQSKKLVSQKVGVAEVPQQISARIVPAFTQSHEQPQNASGTRPTIISQTQEIHRMSGNKLGKERIPSTIAPSNEALPVRSASAARRSEAPPPPTTVVELRRKQKSGEETKLNPADMVEQAPTRDTRNMLGYVDPGSVHSSASSPSKQSAGAKGSIVSWDSLLNDPSHQLRKRSQGMYSPTGITRRSSASRQVASPHRVHHQDLSGRKPQGTPATIQRARSAPRAESIYYRLRAVTPARAVSVTQPRGASPSRLQSRASPASGRAKSTQRTSSRRAVRGAVSPAPRQRSKTPSQSRPVIRLDGK